jgi:hypothetical protein
MIVVLGSKRLAGVVASAVKDAVDQSERDARASMAKLRKVSELEQEITKLTIEKDRKQEEWDRREREIEHKVGLEQKRQEFEISQAKRDTQVTVREENLAADKERFKAEMDFQRKRLEEEVASLRTLVGQMLERLPSAEIYADLSGKGKK